MKIEARTVMSGLVVLLMLMFVTWVAASSVLVLTDTVLSSDWLHSFVSLGAVVGAVAVFVTVAASAIAALELVIRVFKRLWDKNPTLYIGKDRESKDLPEVKTVERK